MKTVSWKGKARAVAGAETPRPPGAVLLTCSLEETTISKMHNRAVQSVEQNVKHHHSHTGPSPSSPQHRAPPSTASRKTPPSEAKSQTRHPDGAPRFPAATSEARRHADDAQRERASETPASPPRPNEERRHRIAARRLPAHDGAPRGPQSREPGPASGRRRHRELLPRQPLDAPARGRGPTPFPAHSPLLPAPLAALAPPCRAAPEVLSAGRKHFLPRPQQPPAASRC